jgi:hypothetical protein
MSDWLRRLNELNPERHPSSERSEIPRNSHFGDNGPNGPGISSLKQPPLDPDGSHDVLWGTGPRKEEEMMTLTAEEVSRAVDLLEGAVISGSIDSVIEEVEDGAAYHNLIDAILDLARAWKAVA